MFISFFFPEHKISLQERTRLKDFIIKLFKKEGFKVDSLSYIFCSDEYLLDLNQQFLKHDYYTDIITFDFSDTKGRIDGEIYISTDRVKDNAKNLKLSFKAELHRVIFHGALHLCGYKDKTKDQIQKIRAMENKYLDLYLF